MLSMSQGIVRGIVMVRQFVVALSIASSGLCGIASTAKADSAPQFVIPGRTGGPIIINHYDARWAVVEGDWGLNRPGHGTQTVIGGRYVGPPRRAIHSYHPTGNRKPELGRHEVEPSPDRQAPPPAESFSRNWSTTSSEPVPPADLPNPNAEGVPVGPPIIVAPQIGPRRRH